MKRASLLILVLLSLSCPVFGQGAIERAAASRFNGGTAAPPAKCNVRDIYYRTTTATLYVCDSPDHFSGMASLSLPVTAAQGGTGSDLSAAGAGKYPKSNGATPAVFAASTLAASGVGACKNQAVTALNGDAAPTCTTITSAYTSGTFPATAHNLLSAIHGDTTITSAVRGSIIYANSTSTWTALGLQTAGKYPKWDGNDLVASTLAASGVGSPTACTNQFVTGFTLAGDAAPTSACTSIVAGDLGTTLTPQFARIGAGQAADATAPFAGTIDSATTNTILDVLKLTRSTTGTASNGIGAGFALYAEDASGNIEEAGRFQASFPIATHATQTGRVDITVMGAPGGSLASDSTAWGVNAALSNIGANQTATGVGAGQYNIGGAQTATGMYAGNSNTGDNQTATGMYAGNSNTGASQTATGYSAGRSNTGGSQTATGFNAGNANTGASQTATGVNAGRYNNWPNITRIGYQSSIYFPDDAGSLKNITEASITAANTITYVAHGFGTPGGKVNVRYLLTGGTPPAGLVHNTIYQFTVTSADVLTLSGIAYPAAAFTGTLNNSTDTSNSIAIGVDANPTKANQAVLGPSSITETLLRGNVGIGTVVPVGRLQSKFTVTTPIIFATGDTLGSYTSVTFPTANKDYANKTGICTACAVGDLVIITAGTGAYTGQYSVLLKISDNSIQLSRTCHNEAGDIVDGAVSIVGSPALSIGSNRIFAKALLSNASSNETAFRYDYSVNKVAGNSTGLQINATHDLAPGTNLPFQVTVGGAEILKVTSVGTLTAASAVVGGSSTLSSDVLSFIGTSAKTIYVDRRTNAGTGHGLNLYAGGAKAGETNTAGGTLLIASNIGTGNAAGSQFIVQTPTPIGTGTTDQTLVTRTITDVTGQTINYGHLRFISEATPGAPTSNAPTAGGSCTAGEHSFVTTFVTSNGETQYGAASAAQTCGANATVPLSAIPTGTSGVTTGRNICASKAGTTTPLYQVGASPTIADNSTTTYDFVTADGSLTVACNAADGTTGGIWVDGTKRIQIDPVTGYVRMLSGYLYGAGGVYANLGLVDGLGASLNYGSANVTVGSGTVNINAGGASIAIFTTAGLNSYKGISTVSNGIPVIYGTVDLTAQATAIGATTIYANPATPAAGGQYRVCYLALTKKAGDAVNLALQLTFTTPDDSSTAQNIASANVAINTVGAYTQGCPTIVAKASTNIQYATTLSGGIGAGEYSLWIKVEKL